MECIPLQGSGDVLSALKKDTSSMHWVVGGGRERRLREGFMTA